ncbi:type II toxin-antitoxin system HipA family toxin [Caulobacter segnis]|uniref:type II toxin-antitoxin system HipA family toxin n=1 Tax=Caulobacter segnis TaxID=88688 RepID=UPI002410582F|nr:type II toxin-antitoxin system HipA family toxin [Caulobacter segnis]MDG2520478.1 type II toxin-antitoxin system HipA family toxin [Caulobacter segnis]
MTDFSAQVALGESLTPVGRLRFTHTGPRQFSNFTYDPDWIADARAFALQPDMPLDEGNFFASGQPGHMRDALTGVFSDAAPDTWGRRLLERAYGAGLSEFEYLTLSDDACRQGALRFVDDSGEVIRGAAEAVPRLVDLEAITQIARAYEQGQEISAADIQTLAGAGGSGGARPKANVADGDTLWLAKFTSAHDQAPIERVEVATLRLARACGIRTPEVRLELAGSDFPVALIRRFDRRGKARIPYISARTALVKTGVDLGAYTEIVDFIRGWSADPAADFRELYLRLVFTILVSNKDDHLKNHGFLYVGGQRWRLSPAFDINPAPDRNPHLETAIMEGGTHERSILLALEACPFFEMRETEARAMIKATAERIAADWREALRKVGVSGNLARAYEPAFNHAEADIALSL